MSINYRKKKLVNKPCPNHEYRSRTIRNGRLAKFCSLCMDQNEMMRRWKKIREVLTVVSRSTRRSSAAGATASVSEPRNPQQVILIIPVVPPAVAQDLHIVLVVNYALAHV